MTKYTIANFNEIKLNGFMCTLPEETLKIINDISKHVGSPTYVKTPVFIKKTSTTEPKKNLLPPIPSRTDNVWQTVRSFKATKILDEKTEIDVQINTIRSYLNKITDKNYIQYRNDIFDIVDVISEEEMNKVGKHIFDIASTIRFYSKQYADLYADLIQKNEIMNTIFKENFSGFLDLFNNINFIEPTKDYDLFCKYNKENEKRRALSAFFVNLMKNKVISEEQIIDIIEKLFDILKKYQVLPNKNNEIDEIVENIVILFDRYFVKMYLIRSFDSLNENDINTIKVQDLLKMKNEFNQINSTHDADIVKVHNLINEYASYNSKTFPSLLSKSIFKFMDLSESLIFEK
jgi:hypothetical protein